LKKGKKTGMEPDLSTVLCLSAVFFAGGFLDGISGGGGLLTIPALLLADVPPESAMGTNKAAAIGGLASSLTTYARCGLVDWPSVVRGLPFALIGGLAGSRALLFFSSEAIGTILVFLLPLGLVITLLPKRDAAKTREFGERELRVRTGAVCLLVGLYDGFFGPGSGSFYILGFHSFLGMGLVQASATIKPFNLAAATGAACIFALRGNVPYLLTLPLTAANIAGNTLGSKIVIRVGPAFVRRVLTLSLGLLFVSLIWKFFLARLFAAS
jgi:uncharacterized membrane protein YfcA